MSVFETEHIIGETQFRNLRPRNNLFLVGSAGIWSSPDHRDENLELTELESTLKSLVWNSLSAVKIVSQPWGPDLLSHS